MESLNTKLYEKYKKLKVLLFPFSPLSRLGAQGSGCSFLWFELALLRKGSSLRRRGGTIQKMLIWGVINLVEFLMLLGTPRSYLHNVFLLEIFDGLENRVSCSCGGPDWRIEEYEWAASCEIVSFNRLMTWSNWSSLTYQESEERLNFVLLWFQVFHSGAVCWMREVTAWREQEM